MSDGDVNAQQPQTEVQPQAEAAAPAAAPVEEKPLMDLATALKTILKEALVRDNLARGIHECAKLLHRGTAQLCLLASDCEEQGIVTLVEALCKENNIHLLRVPSNKDLGEWAGLCKLDREGNPRKKFDAEGNEKQTATPRCSCVVIKQYGIDSEAKRFVENIIAQA